MKRKTNKDTSKIKHKLPNKLLILIPAIFIFALFAVFGLSIFTGNKEQTNIGSSLASVAQPADINSDNKVDVFDLSILLSKWNTNDTLSDLNKDATVNVFDLSILLSRWGAVTTSTKPDATNTGVPAGTTLRSLAQAYPDSVAQGYTVNAQGRVTITKDGGIYDSVSFPDGVVVKAKNVTIKKSRISGGISSFATMLPEPTSWDQCRTMIGVASGGQLLDANSSLVSNLLVEDTEIMVNPSEYSIFINTFMGHDTTMRRVNIHGGVDGIGTHNAYATTANFTLEDSYIHDLYKGQWSPGNYNLIPGTTTRMYCGYDAAHPEGTHNDGIQMHDGANVYIYRNSFFVNAVSTFVTNSNAGLMMNGAGNVHVANNHFRYGVCSINMPAGLVLPIEVINNTFYGNNGFTSTAGQDSNGCAIIRSSTGGYMLYNNLWENGTAARILNG